MDRAAARIQAPHLAGLLALVGPANRDEFLTRLTGDLKGVAFELGATDPVVQRRALHVLIALAGTLGAERLLARSRRLHGANGAVPPDELSAAQAELADLRQAVALLAVEDPA